MRAIVVTGGKGSRLKPFTKHMPKHLLPVGQFSLLANLLRQLDSAPSIESIEVVVGWMAELILHEIENLNLSTPIKILYDTECSGSWWPIVIQRIRLLPQDEPLLVLLGDIFTIFDIEQSVGISSLAMDNFIVLSFLASHAGLYRGVLEFEAETSKVRHYHERVTVEQDWINVGIYIFTPQILLLNGLYQFYPENQLFPRLIDSNRLVAFPQVGIYAINVNTAIELYWANMAIFKNDIIRSAMGITGKHSISPRAQVHESAIIGDSVVVGDNAVIGRNVVLEQCVVLPHTKIGPGTELKRAIIGPYSQISIAESYS